MYYFQALLLLVIAYYVRRIFINFQLQEVESLTPTAQHPKYLQVFVTYRFETEEADFYLDEHLGTTYQERKDFQDRRSSLQNCILYLHNNQCEDQFEDIKLTIRDAYHKQAKDSNEIVYIYIESMTVIKEVENKMLYPLVPNAKSVKQDGKRTF